MKILIAKDEAFNFVYQANVDALKRLGEISYFSPLHDAALPPCDVLYLPGGYPELYTTKLTANTKMKTAIKNYAEKGLRIFAECGGFLYLCKQIDDAEMCDVLPLEATMKNAHLHLGYRQMNIKGTAIKGHEFHYSSVMPPRHLPKGMKEYKLQSNAAGHPVNTSIYIYKNIIAGYTHWYWAEIGFEQLWQAIISNYTL